MIEPRLQFHFSRLDRTLRRAALHRKLAAGWAAAAGVGLLVLFSGVGGFAGRALSLVPVAIAVAVALVTWSRFRRAAPNARAVVARLEQAHPELRHLLSAAAEQQPRPGTGDFSYLQLRVIEEVLSHPGKTLWRAHFERAASIARGLHALAIAAALVPLLLAGYGAARGRPVLPTWGREITVIPGDTQVERGTSLIISARFGRQAPAEAALVVVSSSGQVRRIPMERHLADPVFGATVAEVKEDATYRVEYRARSTRDYRVSVFELPALVRADALLSFPEYTGMTNKAVRDTRRVSAVEGSRLTYTLHLNKPVVQARLVGASNSLPLVLLTNATAVLNDLVMTNSGRYVLELTDAEGRTNRAPPEFSIQVLTNRRPELKLVFPRGDPRVSPLEEIQLRAEAVDDFGLLKYGIGLAVAGKEPQDLELGGGSRANEKRQLARLVCAEDLQMEPEQILAYYVWATDHGPDGRPRRTVSDVFFAEIRPFEEVFRKDDSGMSEQGQQGQQGEQGQSARLAEQQKQIMIATWKLQEERGEFGR